MMNTEKDPSFNAIKDMLMNIDVIYDGLKMDLEDMSQILHLQDGDDVFNNFIITSTKLQSDIQDNKAVEVKAENDVDIDSIAEALVKRLKYLGYA